MRKQKLVEKEVFVGNVKEVKDGKVLLDSGKSVKFDPEVHELSDADKEIAPWLPPDYVVLPSLNKVVSDPEPGKPVKVLPDEEAHAVEAEFADSHTAKEQSDKNLAVKEPTGHVDIKAREQAKEGESARLAAEAAAEADKSKKSHK